MNIPANDPTLRSWIPVPANSDFPIQNIPFGIGSYNSDRRAPMTRIGDHVVDLSILFEAGFLNGLELPIAAFDTHSLNTLLRLGKPTLRNCPTLSELFREDDPSFGMYGCVRLHYYQ